jgi:ABC-type Zn uptake system ZnuABC Zn-binding protein ZnuA
LVGQRKASFWAAAVLVVSVLAACAPAASTQEAEQEEGAEHEHEEGEEHEHVEMALPEIAPVDLAEGERLEVVATTSIVGDVVGNVGGKAIDLTVLIGIGQDPHSYEPAPQALAAIEDANVVFVNGLDLEEVLMETVENTASGPVVPVSAGIEPLAFGDHEHEEEGEEHEDEGEEHEHEHAGSDPHFWMAPANVIVWTDNIAHVLSEADPANADLYAVNAESYRAALEEVDDYAREQIALIPEERCKLVTDHRAFGYFADAYGFEVIGTVIPSMTTTTGASAGDVAALVEVIRAEGVPAVFVGASASQGLQDLAATIADEVGGEVRVLPLLSGSLAPEGQPGDTYLGFIRYNVDQVVDGLAE